MRLRRFIDRVRRRQREPGADPAGQAARVEAVLATQGAVLDLDELLGAVIAALGDDDRLAEGTVGNLIRHLRGVRGEPGTDAAHVAFWQVLAERFESPLALACRADTLLQSGRAAEGVEAFLEAFEIQPSLVYEFGGDLFDRVQKVGGTPWLRYQLVCLRASLTDVGDPETDDTIREIYSQLLDEHAGEAGALARIRQVGAKIDELVAAGRLPRALVRRGASRC